MSNKGFFSTFTGNKHSQFFFIFQALPRLDSTLYYRKRGSVSYIVREVHSVRERESERERYREKDGSDVTIVALKLAMSFALLLAKNVHLSIGEEFCAFPCQKICTSVSPLLIGAEFTLSVAKNVVSKSPLQQETDRQAPDRLGMLEGVWVFWKSQKTEKPEPRGAMQPA